MATKGRSFLPIFCQSLKTFGCRGSPQAQDGASMKSTPIAQRKVNVIAMLAG
jgi:hypothetical protein